MGVTATIRPEMLRGTFWMFGALASFLGMGVAGRELSSELSVWGILFVRSLSSMAILLLLLPIVGTAALRTRRPLAHLGRNIIHLGGQWGWFIGIALLPIAEVFAIEFTAPIMVAVLAAIFLGEKLTRTRLASVGLGFVGVMIILRPGVEVIDPAAFYVIFAAFCYALVYVATRHMATTEKGFTIIFYMSVIQLPIVAIPAWPDMVMPSQSLWPWVVVVGAAGPMAHYCLTRAFSLAEASVLVPIDFLRLPFAALIGFLVYNEPLEIAVLIGAIVIFGGNLVNVWGERGK